MTGVRTIVGRAGLVVGLATMPATAQEPGRVEKSSPIAAPARGSERDVELHQRRMQLEMERAEAQFELKKAEIARARAEFRLRKIGLDLDILTQLDRPLPMKFAKGVSLEGLSKYIRESTKAPGLPDGLPIYVDPVGLQEADKTMASEVEMNLEGIPLRTTFRLLLRQLSLTYTVKDGLVTITSEDAADEPIGPDPGLRKVP